MRVTLIAAFTAVLASSIPALAQDLPPGTETVLSAPGGRYVFGQISEYRRDQYMLDTKTGRLWVISEDKKGARILSPVPYDAGDISDFPEGMESLLAKAAADAKAEKSAPNDHASDVKKGPWSAYQEKSVPLHFLGTPVTPPAGYKLDPPRGQ